MWRTQSCPQDNRWLSHCRWGRIISVACLHNLILSAPTNSLWPKGKGQSINHQNRPLQSMHYCRLCTSPSVDPFFFHLWTDPPRYLNTSWGHLIPNLKGTFSLLATDNHVLILIFASGSCKPFQWPLKIIAEDNRTTSSGAILRSPNQLPRLELLGLKSP